MKNKKRASIFFKETKRTNILEECNMNQQFNQPAFAVNQPQQQAPVQQKTEQVATFVANGEEVELSLSTVRNYLVSGNGNVTDQEIVMFINLCKYQHLNPFLNEAYIVKFGNSPAQLITSKEAFIKRAEANEHYRGSKAGVIVVRNNEVVYMNGAFALSTDELVGGWAEVKRDDREGPIHIEISFEEFSKKQATWRDMPANMIRKTALVNALREAFPDALGSLYTEDDKSPTASVQPNKNTEAPKVVEAKEAADDIMQQALEVDVEEANTPQSQDVDMVDLIEEMEDEK